MKTFFDHLWNMEPRLKPKRIVKPPRYAMGKHDITVCVNQFARATNMTNDRAYEIVTRTIRAFRLKEIDDGNQTKE